MSGESHQVIGHSVDGNEINAYRFGEGGSILMLMAGIHGGWEANTVELAQQLITYFEQHPEDVLDGISLVIVPVANPDGYAFGRTARGRFNGDGVDLNRNWSCDWSSEAYWRQERVNPGLAAFSEPETQALANFIFEMRPAALLSYHSSADGVFPGSCGGDRGSLAMSARYAEAAGYSCCERFSAYPVSGTVADWANAEGIPAADVELTQSDDPEFSRNFRGVMALQAWLQGQ